MAYTLCLAPLELFGRCHRFATIRTMELPTVVLSTLAGRLTDVSWTST